MNPTAPGGRDPGGHDAATRREEAERAANPAVQQAAAEKAKREQEALAHPEKKSGTEEKQAQREEAKNQKEIDKAAEEDVKAQEEAAHEAAKQEAIARHTTERVMEEDAKRQQEADDKAKKDQEKGYTKHAEGLGLESGGHYAVSATGLQTPLKGTLIRTNDTGIVLKQDGLEHTVFLPWHAVHGVHKD